MSLHPNTKSQTPFKSDLNSAVDMSTATQYHLSVNFEWLKGCQYSCKGCHVNKKDDGSNDSAMYKCQSWMYSMVRDGNYLPTIAFLGPTDYLTADNTLDVLNDPRAFGILRQFKRLSLQTTYLNIDRIEKIKKLLYRHYSHMELELNFVIEADKLNNQKYMDLVKANRERVVEILDWPNPVLSFCILNVYEYDRIKSYNAKALLADYRQLDEKIKSFFGCTIDFNFSMTRTSWWTNRDVENAVRSVSRIFDEGVDHEFNQTVRFSFGKLTDSLIEKHYNWRAGDLYISPMLYERIVSFHSSLKVPLQNLSVEDVEAFEEKLLVQQYDNLVGKDCLTCQYRATCIERNILTFMDMHDIKGCIIARKALDAINKLD